MQTPDIEVFTIPLNTPEITIESLFGLLLPIEISKVASLSQEQAKRFALLRAIIRFLVNKKTKIPMDHLIWTTLKHGKPVFENAEIEFNLSHSKDFAMFALSTVGAVGIDLEFMDATRNLSGLAERFFTQSENKIFNSASESQKIETFYTLWTRKESLHKAVGIPVTHPLTESNQTLFCIKSLKTPSGYQAHLATFQSSAVICEKDFSIALFLKEIL